MKKFFASLIIALFSATSFAQTTIGIGSGQKTGTNWPMVEDIVRVCSNSNTQIKNVVSDGSLDNLFKIYSDKNTQYGIVQQDALVYQQGLDPKMMQRIQMVFPFFSTEVHLVVNDRSNIRSLSDLVGKKVVEGPEGSGTWVTVQVIKSITGMNWSGYQFSQKDGLNAVRDGMVDAMFVVAGMPVGMLSNVQSGLRLIPLNHPKLDSFGYYTKTMIPGGKYPFQKTAVQTYKVDNVLATYAFKNQYQREIGDFVSCITRNIETLQTTGHEKWRDVDPLDIERIKWQVHPAALAAIKREMKGR